MLALCSCNRHEATRRESAALSSRPPAAAPASATAPAPSASAPTLPAFSCDPADPWPGYGHDGRRTSRSGQCVEGPLRLLWKASPATPVRERPPSFEHVVSTGEGLYATGLRGKSSMLHGLNLDGSPRWDHDTRTDLHFAYWPIVAHGVVGMNDDGAFFLDPQTGKMRFNQGLDSWGQIAADAERFYWTNTWHVHGPALYLLASTPLTEPLWKQNKYGGTTPMDMMDDLGGVAVDGDAVFQTANYKFASFSGVSCFEAATGKPRWLKNGTPVGYPSAEDGRVLVVERWQKERRVVARSQRDGEVLWSTPLKGALGAAPALAGGLVLVDTDKAAVVALDAATGQQRWRAELDARRPTTVGNETTLAVAANHTVVVTLGKEIVLLSLQGGEVRWRGPLAEAPLHSPVLADGRVYAVAGGEIFAFGP